MQYPDLQSDEISVQFKLFTNVFEVGSLYSGFFQQLIADNDSWSHKILMRKSPSISFSNVCMREDPRSLGRSYSIVDFVSIVIFDWSICARFLFDWENFTFS